MNNRTLYEILEVSEDASAAVIKAAYRILASQYHPDKADNKANLHGKNMSDINEAYRILSDVILKNKYDKNLFEERNKNKDFDNKYSNSNSNYYSAFKSDSSSIEKWKIAEGYYPELKDISNHLFKISEDIFLKYTKEILEKKKYSQKKYVADQIELDFLISNFGKNTRAQYFGRKLLMHKHMSAAEKFRQTIKTLDENIDISKIEKIICNDFHLSDFYTNYMEELSHNKQNDPVLKKSSEVNDVFLLIGFSIFLMISITLYFYFN